MSLFSDDERLILTHSRANALLEGADADIDAVIALLGSHLAPPVFSVTGEGAFALPADRRGTLIVRRSNRLTEARQRQLLHWMDARIGAARVIATASEPLLPLVGSGAFLATLYYRLNVIKFDVSVARHESNAD